MTDDNEYAPSAMLDIRGSAEARGKGPRGRGIWISFNRHSTIDVENAVLVEQAQRAGFGWLCAKIGDDGRSTRWLGRGVDLIRRCKDAGLGIFTWNYSKPGTWQTQAAAIAQVIADGSEGHVIDAETEWEWVPNTVDHEFSQVDRRADAVAFADRLRTLVGDAWLAHAPIWRPQSHQGFPFAEFGARVDAVLPQAYWCAAGQNVASFCARLEDAWRALATAHPEAVPMLMPIGLTYGAGDQAGDLWTSDPRSVRLTEDDLRAFSARYPTCSFFSWDVATSTFWQTMNALRDERAPDTVPAPPSVPDPS